MKKLILLLTMSVIMLACGNSHEDRANERLEAARVALEQDDYNEAKLQIDSIKKLYPDAFKARKAAQDFLCIVVLKEQQHNLRYLSSVLQTKQQEFEAIKGRYILQKNPKYQALGNYLWRTQVVGNGSNRNFLRFQVSEQGLMTMTSFYHGSRFIHHRIVKVIASDGTYAVTPSSANPYEDSNLGVMSERNDYHYESDGGVINFLYLNRHKNLRVEYIGSGNCAVSFTASDRQALENMYALAHILTSIQNIKGEIEECNTKIKFILTKQKYDAIATQKESHGDSNNH